MKVMNGAHHNCNPVTLCKLFARGYNWVPGRASPSENSSMHTLVNGNRKTKQTSKTATLPFWNILTHDISRPFRAGKWLSYVEMTITTQGILGATDHTLHVLRVAACLAILQNTNTQVSNKFCWPSDMYCSVLSSCRDYILYISLYIALPFRFTCLLIFCLLVGAIKLSNCPNRPEAFVHQEDRERYGLRFTFTSRPFFQLCAWPEYRSKFHPMACIFCHHWLDCGGFFQSLCGVTSYCGLELRMSTFFSKDIRQSKKSTTHHRRPGQLCVLQWHQDLHLGNKAMIRDEMRSHHTLMTEVSEENLNTIKILEMLIESPLNNAVMESTLIRSNPHVLRLQQDPNLDSNCLPSLNRCAVPEAMWHVPPPRIPVSTRMITSFVRDPNKP